MHTQLPSHPLLPVVYQPRGLREVAGPHVDALVRTISTAASWAFGWQPGGGRRLLPGLMQFLPGLWLLLPVGHSRPCCTRHH